MAGTPMWPNGSLLAALEPDDQARLLRLGVEQQFDRGAVLMREGEHDRHVVLLLHGRVTVLTATVDGRTAVHAVRLRGELIGELAALDDKPRSATVQTNQRTIGRVITQLSFLDHLAAHPHVASAVHRSVAGKLRQTVRSRTDIAGASVPVRVARILDQLGGGYGLPAARGAILLDVPITQSELAALVGAAEVSVQRALGDLRVKGIVRTGYRQVLIEDPAALNRIARDLPD